MNEIKLLIVENNPLEAMEMEVFAQEAGMRVIGKVSSGEQALHFLTEQRPDLVIFDIHLDGDLDGVETAKIVKTNWNLPILFLTEDTQDETMRRAARSRAEYYLPKPFTENHFQSAIRFALVRFAEQASDTPEWFALNDSFFLYDDGGYRKFRADDVLFLRASGEKTIFHFADNSRFTCNLRLGELAQKIRQPDFLRVHRSFVVNIKKVEGIRQGMLIFPHGLTASFSNQYLADPAVVFPIVAG